MVWKTARGRIAAMKTNGRGRRLGLVVGLWVAAAGAQEAPAPVVLTVLGTNYTARDLEVGSHAPANLLTTRTFLKIQGGIMGAYLEKLNYQPSEEDLKEYCRRSAPTAAELKAAFDRQVSLSTEEICEGIWREWKQGADDPDGAMRMAAEDLKQWKFIQALFAQYGGRVSCNEYFGPGVPDAVQFHLAACEAAGDFTIHDAELRGRFWELMRMPSPVPLVSEEDGRAALAGHPADRQKRHTMAGMKNHLHPEQPAVSAPSR